jgi:predicted transcriptional regulator
MRFGFGQQQKTPELGALELQVLKCLWSAAAPVDARAVHAALSARRISLSTVQATLERLHRKALLARAKVGRAYLYSTTVSRETLIGALIRNVANRLADGELEPVISGFVELVGDADPKLLDELQASAAKVRKKEPR